MDWDVFNQIRLLSPMINLILNVCRDGWCGQFVLAFYHAHCKKIFLLFHLNQPSFSLKHRLFPLIATSSCQKSLSSPLGILLDTARSFKDCTAFFPQPSFPQDDQQQSFNLSFGPSPKGRCLPCAEDSRWGPVMDKGWALACNEGFAFQYVWGTLISKPNLLHWV